MKKSIFHRDVVPLGVLLDESLKSSALLYKISFELVQNYLIISRHCKNEVNLILALECKDKISWDN